MKGKYEIIVKNARIRYKFTIERNITILRGDSATGKTTLIDMIYNYQLNGENSGVSIQSKKNLVVLTALNWKLNLSQIKDSIVFIDEGDPFVKSTDFARSIKETDNYYVIATRASLLNLPYSVKEIYGIKNVAGNRYQGTKRLYSEFYPLCKTEINYIHKPELVIVEDSNSGYEFWNHIFTKYSIHCYSANGKSNVYNLVKESEKDNILIICDGAAFGPEVERVLILKKIKNLMIYLPESFEWIILSSGIVQNIEITDILDKPYDYIESKKHFSWERFFTELLISYSLDTGYLQYNKNQLNENYLHKHQIDKILSVVPEIHISE